MLFKTLLIGLPLALPFALTSTPTPAPEPAPVFHCQVPCGIYGDKLRIDLMLEDAATIEKAMGQIAALETDAGLDKNQLVRWIMTKEEHAQNLQDQVAAYWLAQRVKAPAEGQSKDTYHAQLEHLHAMTVAAMKCKQTIETGHVARLRELAEGFSATYFSAEDMAHLREHSFSGDE